MYLASWCSSISYPVSIPVVDVYSVTPPPPPSSRARFFFATKQRFSVFSCFATLDEAQGISME